MDIQNEREEFEIAYSEIFSPIVKRPYPVLENGDYKYIEIDQAWKLWQAKSQAVPECKWVADENGIYDTGCRNKFVLNCDTPHKNGMFHCCYCGGKLIEAQEQSHD